MDIITIAFTLLHFIGAVEMVMRRFKQIRELEGGYRTGAFQNLNNINNVIGCSRHCISCVTFVYHVGDRKCYLYDWPLTNSTTGITYPGGSVVYLTIHDVVVPGRFLSHYLAHKHEVWYFSLNQPIIRWTDARSKCSEMGGEMPQLLGNDIYEVLNGLDAAYPGVLQAGNYDGYWIAMMEDGSGNWVNVDGSSAEPLIWHQNPDQPDGGSFACGAISHDKTYFPNASPIFQLDDLGCVENSQWAARYVCRFTDL